MKPMLSLDMILGGGGGGPAPAVAGTSPTDDLAHRLVHIVWANGEALDTPVPTRGTALLQHGFKEWSGARGVSVIPRGHGAGRTDPAAVLRVVQACDDENWTPLVLCHDAQTPLHVLNHLLAAGPCGLLALGAPSGLRLAAPRREWQGTRFPLPLPQGADPALCLWLGAPDALMRPRFELPGGLRVASRDLHPLALPPYLELATERLHSRAPANLWCVLFLDDVVLGDAPATHPQGVPPEALAATLRWLQAQETPVVVFMVSHERVTALQRGRLAELARHLGGALHRHVGVRREAFPAHAAPPLRQKNL
jgi:hypothetical protein